jgi:hypothetical protein
LKEKERVKLRRLDHRADALGAQRLLHFTALLKNCYLLQVGAEGAVGSPQGEGTVVTESGRLATVSAFSHCKSSFLAVLLPACNDTLTEEKLYKNCGDKEWNYSAERCNSVGLFLQARNSTIKRILPQVKCY